MEGEFGQDTPLPRVSRYYTNRLTNDQRLTCVEFFNFVSGVLRQETRLTLRGTTFFVKAPSRRQRIHELRASTVHQEVLKSKPKLRKRGRKRRTVKKGPVEKDHNSANDSYVDSLEEKGYSSSDGERYHGPENRQSSGTNKDSQIQTPEKNRYTNYNLEKDPPVYSPDAKVYSPDGKGFNSPQNKEYNPDGEGNNSPRNEEYNPAKNSHIPKGRLRQQRSKIVKATYIDSQVPEKRQGHKRSKNSGTDKDSQVRTERPRKRLRKNTMRNAFDETRDGEEDYSLESHEHNSSVKESPKKDNMNEEPESGDDGPESLVKKFVPGMMMWEGVIHTLLNDLPTEGLKLNKEELRKRCFDYVHQKYQKRFLTERDDTDMFQDVILFLSYIQDALVQCPVIVEDKNLYFYYGEPSNQETDRREYKDVRRQDEIENRHFCDDSK